MRIYTCRAAWRAVTRVYCLVGKVIKYTVKSKYEEFRRVFDFY